MKSIWLIIWRFQPLHLWHHLLIEQSLRENPATLVLIGSSNISDSQNPYSYETRREIIQANFQDASLSIWPLPDTPNDRVWIQEIINNIPKTNTHIHIYCGDTQNDSAVQVILAHKDIFPCKIEIHEIPRSTIDISASQIREWKQSWQESKVQKYVSHETSHALSRK